MKSVLIRFVLMAAAGILAGCNGKDTGRIASADLPRFEDIADGADFPVQIPGGFESRRGYLIVAEKRNGKAPSEIRLPVAIVRARQEPPGEDRAPIVFLGGGPGIGSLAAAAYPAAYPWTRDRDFIIIGQRGTDHARPALMCPDYLESMRTLSVETDNRVAAATSCRLDLEAVDVDLSAYHTLASARDLNDLRTVLGVKTWSFFGLSYGTRLALTYAREFPDTLSSMVLDSPLPHTARYDDESVANTVNALVALAEACAAQSACAKTYPDLFNRFSAAISSAMESPWRVEQQDGERVTITAADLASMVSLGSPAAIKNAPMLMDAIARGDVDIIMKNSMPREPTPFAWGMRLSVWCGEALPFSKRARASKPTDGFAGLDSAVVPPEVCAAWGVPARPTRDVAATRSSVPTLIIAGEYDTDTPPKWAYEASESLDQSHVVIVPHGLHTETSRWDGDGCAMKIAARFFSGEAVFMQNPELATGCLDERQLPDFTIRTDAF